MYLGQILKRSACLVLATAFNLVRVQAELLVVIITTFFCLQDCASRLWFVFRYFPVSCFSGRLYSFINCY